MADVVCPTCQCDCVPRCTLEGAFDFFSERQHRAVSLGCADGSPAPRHRKTSVLSLWNRQALFVVFVGACESTPPSPCGTAGRTERLWELQEVVECFIGREARRDNAYWEFEVAPDGRWLDLDIRLRDGRISGDSSNNTGFRCHSKVEAGVWSAALEIPWALLSPSGDSPETWECNFYRAAPEQLGGYLMAWSPTGYGPQCFHRPERFGRLILCE